jgi:hypothetical protein
MKLMVHKIIMSVLDTSKDWNASVTGMVMMTKHEGYELITARHGVSILIRFTKEAGYKAKQTLLISHTFVKQQPFLEVALFCFGVS